MGHKPCFLLYFVSNAYYAFDSKQYVFMFKLESPVYWHLIKKLVFVIYRTINHAKEGHTKQIIKN